MTSKYPLCVILMELAMQLVRRGLELRLCRGPRDQNMAADALTKNNFQDAEPAKRTPIDPCSMNFVVLDELLATGEDLYQQFTEHHALPPRKKRLKDREPL